ncbi:MAG TPA: hypothetical protein PLV68_01305 [Ilumatobacteraceae bacterium]|nr:hypothetical protein [Ilumatobacteraceae bacterium]
MGTLSPALQGVPRPAAKRLAIRVSGDALRQIRGGHPWVFDRAITAMDGRSVGTDGGVAGDLGVVFDHDRRFAAIGLYDPHSPIRLRILHHGRPTTIDAAFFVRRLAAAIERRATLADPTADQDTPLAGGSIERGDGETNAYRLVHGENDGFPGLVLDRYASTLVLKLYTTAWLPHLHDLAPAIDAALAPRRLLVRFSRDAAGIRNIAQQPQL